MSVSSPRVTGAGDMLVSLKRNTQVDFESVTQRPELEISPSLMFSMMPNMSEAGRGKTRDWLWLPYASNFEIRVAYGIIRFQDHLEQIEKEKIGRPEAFTHFLYRAGFSLSAIKYLGGNYRYFLPDPDGCSHERQIRKQLRVGLGLDVNETDDKVFQKLVERARAIEQDYNRIGQEKFYT